MQGGVHVWCITFNPLKTISFRTSGLLPNRNSDDIVIPMRCVVFLLIFAIPSLTAPSCATHRTTFDAFLKKYNPWGNGPKATVSVVTAELGKPINVSAIQRFGHESCLCVRRMCW